MLDFPGERPATILAVDDEPANRYARARGLRKAGFTVVEAATGAEALRLAADRPDLILLDVNLPDLDGFEVCRRLKADPATAAIPILQTSAQRVGPEDRVQGLEGGADGYLVLPLEAAELVAHVKALLRLRHAQERERAARAELERLTEQLRDQQQWLQAVLNLLPVPLLFLEPDSPKVAFANKAAHDLAGGQFPSQFESEPPAPAGADGRPGAGAEVEWDTPASRRSLLVFADTLPPMYGHPATPVRGFLDVTRLKQVEEELRRANRAKDDFLTMLAHELRNPLAPLLNSLHIFRLTAGDNRVLDQARTMMERQLRHMSRLVDDLLDVTRLTRGRVQLHPERLDLGQLVRTAAGDYRPTLADAGLTLTVAVPEAAVWVTGDGTRLRQVLGNLLENAGKFSDRGGRVEVRLEVRPGDREAVLSVSDTGIGIEPEVLPRLFDVFAQADRTLDRTRGGLGLGLAMVKSLVDLHGGTVQASSDGPGRGARFTVRLPLEGEPAALSGQPTGTAPAPDRLRVLIVEDNRDTAESLRMLLGLFGNEVAVSHSGPEGVKAALEWHPDVVLCDIGLPGLDGYGVASELRRTSATARARLIAITGYGRDEVGPRARGAGFDEVLTKPADPALLQQLLARSGSSAGARSA